jgi:hypothetical protein
LLEAMNGAGWARRVEPTGWVLALDLDALSLLDVYRLFAVPAHPAAVTAKGLSAGAGERLAEAERSLDVSLGGLLPEEARFSEEAKSAPPPPAAKDSARSERSVHSTVGSGDPPR